LATPKPQNPKTPKPLNEKEDGVCVIIKMISSKVGPLDGYKIECVLKDVSKLPMCTTLVANGTGA
jgi:hypothetical protein